MKTSATRAPEETRRRILQAAFSEFYRTGFQGGSLNSIVKAAGTTKGALFHHFKDKNDLGYAVVEEIVQPRIKTNWLDPLADSIDPIADVKQAMRRFAKEEQADGRLVQGCPLNNLAQEMSPLDEGFRKRVEKIYSQWRDALEAAFVRGIKAGKVRKAISPRNAATFVVAALAGMIGTAKNAQSEELLKQGAEGLFDYLDSLRP
jgi:AcrR family transcriptional regulator